MGAGPAQPMNMPDRDNCAIRTAEDLGRVIRTHRKALGVDQTDTAGFAGAGTRFLSELERGKPTAQIGKILAILNALGLELVIRPKRRPRDGG